MTLSDALATFRRRALEAAQVGATAPVAAVLDAVCAELAPLANGGEAKPGTTGTGPLRLLTAKEAAALLHVAPRWLYRNAARLPFTRHLSARAVRFEETGLRAWLGRRR